MKYTVITGASSGIGYESARKFASEGKNLIITARRIDMLEVLAKELMSEFEGVDVQVRAYDLSQAENAYAFYEETKKFEVETWINNAGFGNFDPIEKQSLDKVQAMIHLNIETLTILSTLYVNSYADVEGTQLINLSSVGGYTIVENAVTYCATKFYVSAFTEGLAQELVRTGKKMRAKVLAPAATETEFAQRSLDVASFDYDKTVPQFHTAKEMAELMYELYVSDAVVGIVRPSDYTFELNNGKFGTKTSETKV